ncbi:MAG TPA: hypothetical protein VFU10_10020 [Gaiellaceae bacterium]|nr:hypothetical protein [Gaiellaceae bacterium]
MTPATLRFPSPHAYHFALALAFTVVYALALTTYLAAAEIMSPHHAAKKWTGPSWSAPLKGVTPYTVQKDYGTSRGMTCDLTIYTTNKPALDGNARLHPGDTTATVCVVRRVK